MSHLQKGHVGRLLLTLWLWNLANQCTCWAITCYAWVAFIPGLKISYWQKGNILISHDHDSYWEGSSPLIWRENAVGKTSDRGFQSMWNMTTRPAEIFGGLISWKESPWSQLAREAGCWLGGLLPTIGWGLQSSLTPCTGCLGEVQWYALGRFSGGAWVISKYAWAFPLVGFPTVYFCRVLVPTETSTQYLLSTLFTDSPDLWWSGKGHCLILHPVLPAPLTFY